MTGIPDGIIDNKQKHLLIRSRKSSHDCVKHMTQNNFYATNHIQKIIKNIQDNRRKEM